jgi:U32 family peptidase
MKIIAGISNAHKESEIEAYAKAGVDEFFIGYVPAEWSNEYGWEISSNRRETANYQYRSKEDLANIVDLIHNHQRRVYLTVNAHEYNTTQTQLMVKILKNLDNVKFDGFIISNIGMLLELQKSGFEQEMNISIGGGSNNIETLQFFKENFDHIGRFILPRKLTISEIEKIATYAAQNNIRLEAFGMAAYCVFNDEFCFTWHGPSNKCFCQSPMFEHRTINPLLYESNWKDQIAGDQIVKLYNRKATILTEVELQREAARKRYPVKAMSQTEMGRLHILANLNKCGLCSFQKFKDWGIEAVKLPLRGQSFRENLAIIEISKKVIETQNATPEFCQKLMDSPNFCSGSNCYYDYPYAK